MHAFIRAYIVAITCQYTIKDVTCSGTLTLARAFQTMGFGTLAATLSSVLSCCCCSQTVTLEAAVLS